MKFKSILVILFTLLLYDCWKCKKDVVSFANLCNKTNNIFVVKTFTNGSIKDSVILSKNECKEVSRGRFLDPLDNYAPFFGLSDSIVLFSNNVRKCTHLKTNGIIDKSSKTIYLNDSLSIYNLKTYSVKRTSSGKCLEDIIYTKNL
jgi:hypothetical protein